MNNLLKKNTSRHITNPFANTISKRFFKPSQDDVIHIETRLHDPRAQLNMRGFIAAYDPFQRRCHAR